MTQKNCDDCGKELPGAHYHKLYCKDCARKRRNDNTKRWYEKHHVKAEPKPYHNIKRTGGTMFGTGELECYNKRILPLGEIKMMAKEGWVEGLKVQVKGKLMIVEGRKLKEVKL